jgi:hypothetical protein
MAFGSVIVSIVLIRNAARMHACISILLTKSISDTVDGSSSNALVHNVVVFISPELLPTPRTKKIVRGAGTKISPELNTVDVAHNLQEHGLSSNDDGRSRARCGFALYIDAQMTTTPMAKTGAQR